MKASLKWHYKQIQIGIAECSLRISLPPSSGHVEFHRISWPRAGSCPRNSGALLWRAEGGLSRPAKTSEACVKDAKDELTPLPQRFPFSRIESILIHSFRIVCLLKMRCIRRCLLGVQWPILTIFKEIQIFSFKKLALAPWKTAVSAQKLLRSDHSSPTFFFPLRSLHANSLQPAMLSGFSFLFPFSPFPSLPCCQSLTPLLTSPFLLTCCGIRSEGTKLAIILIYQQIKQTPINTGNALPFAKHEISSLNTRMPFSAYVILIQWVGKS